jgi:hypothetical protein
MKLSFVKWGKKVKILAEMNRSKKNNFLNFFEPERPWKSKCAACCFNKVSEKLWKWQNKNADSLKCQFCKMVKTKNADLLK